MNITGINMVPYQPQSNQAKKVNRNLVQKSSKYFESVITIGISICYICAKNHDLTRKSAAEYFLGMEIGRFS